MVLWNRRRRAASALPGALSVVRLAAALQGALGVALGVANLLRWRAAGGGDASDALLAVGAMQIAFSLAVVAAGAWLGRLSDTARIALTCMEAVNATAVLSQVLTPATVVTLLLDALIVLALWTPEVSAAITGAAAHRSRR
jgi:hypothetical protein